MHVVLDSVRIPSGRAAVDADIGVPRDACGTVVFAHGSGSSRHSPRNRYVATQLHAAGLATVLADLLTPEEEAEDMQTARLRFDIDLLATRVGAVTDWVVGHGPASGPVGLFGASTGAAAALVAAAMRPDAVRTVVSRGGRADLAGEHLAGVHQPVLLVVGADDHVVADLNRQAMRQLAGPSRLELVPGATHLFTEPGTLEQVADLARDWYREHLT